MKERGSLTQDKVIICILRHRSDKKTTITEVKECCDKICSTLEALGVEDSYDNQLHIDVDEIMTQVMSRKSIFALGYDGNTIQLKKSINIRDIDNSYALPGVIKNIVVAEIESKDKGYTKKL